LSGKKDAEVVKISGLEGGGESQGNSSGIFQEGNRRECEEISGVAGVKVTWGGPGREVKRCTTR